MLDKIEKEIISLKNPEKAKALQRFFKTQKGEYGKGDIFLGIKVPEQRKIAKKYSYLSLQKIQKLLKNKIHEFRLISLLILVDKYKRANLNEKEDIFNFYLKNTRYINNWDLVDLSAPRIIGDFLYKRNRKILYALANSSDLWEKRISILSTLYFIQYNDFQDSLAISEILLKDKYDLIHKAVGWMLREVGKKRGRIKRIYFRGNYCILVQNTFKTFGYY